MSMEGAHLGVVIDAAVDSMLEFYPGVSRKTALTAVVALLMVATQNDGTEAGRDLKEIQEHFHRVIDCGPDLAQPDWRAEIRLAILNRRPQ